LFRFEAKVTKSKGSEKFKAKKAKKRETKAKKKQKKAKKGKKRRKKEKEKIDLNSASLCFASKQKLLK
jgi:hypothetical protein